MRVVLKSIARGMARAVMLVVGAPIYLCIRLCFGSLRAFQSLSQLLSILPGLTGEYLRREFLALFAEGCGREAVISFGTIFSSPQVSIGDRVYLGSFCIIGQATIGEDTLIASRVSIVSGLSQHGFQDTLRPIREQNGLFTTVEIGRDCWLGEGAVIGANVGEHSIVGAGSVVLNEISPWSVVAGNPGKVIRSRQD